MRRLHSVDRWRAAAVVPADVVGDRGAADHDGGEPGERWEIASGAGGVFEGGRVAVRVLHVRDDHDGVCAFAAVGESDGESDCAGVEWECLPVRDVSADRGGGETGGAGGEGRGAMSEVIRDYIGTELVEIAADRPIAPVV